MSNLNMPRTTHAALTARLAHVASNVERTLCYATTVERSPDGDFRIRQHDNTIAEVSPTELYVTNAGWPSPTTRTRLNAILSAHGLPFYVAQRQGAQVLYQRVEEPADDIVRHVELTRDFRSLTVDFTSNVISVNGAAPVGY